MVVQVGKKQAVNILIFEKMVKDLPETTDPFFRALCNSAVEEIKQHREYFDVVNGHALFMNEINKRSKL